VLVNDGIGFQELIGAESAEGTYRITIRQGNLVAKTHFAVTDPRVPGYLTTSAPDGEPEVLVVGLPSRQRFWLLLYRSPDDYPSSNAVTEHALVGFVSAVAVRADTRGIVAHELRTHPSDPKGCFVVKVAFGQHLLDDLNNTISLICLPLQRAVLTPRL
jgi:hypothetical protein